ncbi:MAG: bifunctional glutamate N-acetyltransferase/amino-acid acetyltransferase ArgJ [Treponema sp.]|jgi:glutamate N-acetyltransferase/amino-acid N-acetyltransferase|nr:bifunctional glutamate N-acetyltransferase/amino-acid acetyltransferase ArgJ [Treponema sp.]
MTYIDGGVCAPKGFRAGGVWCGIKASRQKRDLALIAADECTGSAALFTKNAVKAASVLYSLPFAQGAPLRPMRAIIANSGNANACTGEAGRAAAARMARCAAERLGLAAERVAVASTGVIGVPLPIEAVERGVGPLAASLSADAAGNDAALEAIMTTDTRKKTCAVEFLCDGVPVRIGAMIKGSGMIHPNLGTMLCFITTDLNIDSPALDAALREAARASFDHFTIDGDTSTNDTVFAIASGRAGNPCLHTGDAALRQFTAALIEVCVTLVKQAARDGEGATKLVTVRVKGAASGADALLLGRAVASSSLVKTACFGADANWGRVLCALGYAGAAGFAPDAVSVAFASAAGEVLVCRNGAPVPFDEAAAKKILSLDEIAINITAGAGSGEAAVWGCDLSYDYVRINGDYRS